MSKLELKGSWHETKGRLKQKYGNLTDDGLQVVEGKEEEFFGYLQKELGRTKEDEIEDL